MCEHGDITYETSNVIVRPYRWTIHTLTCPSCGTEACVVDREKMTKTRSRPAADPE